MSPILTTGCLYDYSTLKGSLADSSTIGIPDASGSGGTTTPGSGGDTSAADAGPPLFSTGGNSGTGGDGTGGRTESAGGGEGGGRISGSGGSGRGGTAGAGTGSGGKAVGSGGTGTGGRAISSGGSGTGGFIGTGGAGTGGVSGTGGAGTGGAPGTGGRGTGGAPAGVRILSIDFVGGTLPALLAGGAGGAAATDMVISLPVMAPGEAAGFKRATHWNGAVSLSGSLGGLVLGDGSMTAASVTWSSPPSATRRGVWWVGFKDAPGDVRMMNGYLDPHSAEVPEMPATIIVTGLPTAITTGGYDVYVYTYGELASGTRTYGYSIGATSFTVTQAPSVTTFAGYQLATATAAGNYIVFRNLTDPFFTLTATPGTGPGPRAPVNGIQIVSPSGS